MLKPHPQLIQKALDGLGLPGEAVLYIGDNPQKDMEPARAMGLPVIHFNPKRMHEADCYETAELRVRLERMFPACASD